MPKVGSNHICLVIILIDFVLKKDEDYFPEVFQENVNTLKKGNQIHCWWTKKFPLITSGREQIKNKSW